MAMAHAMMFSFMCIFLQFLAAGAEGEDAAALLAFKAAAVGSSAGGNGVLASWNGNASRVCSWEGVTCGGRYQRVVALNLSGHDLSGTLSPAVGNLTRLQMLELRSNWLHGGIPASLGRLRRLRTLDLSLNTFSGEVLGNLTSCTSLEYLNLGSNKLLTGRIPVELGNTLSRLQMLGLDNNSFVGHWPASLANLTSLRYLTLRMNSLEGTIPPEFGSNMPSLYFLDICSNNLSGSLPSSLYNLSSLTTFDAGNNKLNGTIASDIGEKFPKLQSFTVFNNQFNGEIPSSFSNLTTLTSLQLSMNEFSGFVPHDLGRLNALWNLQLDVNMLEAGDIKGWEFVDSLANCSKLEILVLSNNNFTGQLPISIANLSTTLQTLYLGGSRISGSIPSDIGNLVGLESVYLFDTDISGVIPDSIGKLENLTALYLYNNSLSGHIPSSVGNLTKLIKLFMQSNNLEGPIPVNLGKLKSLNVLDLSRNRLNGLIPKEISELPSLSLYLNLSYNSLTGPLPSEVGSLANLNELILSGNQLSGQIPSSIKNCIMMSVLLLDSNLFQGNIPDFLGDVKGLRVLNLTMNRFSGVIPEALGNIHNLQELYLAYNNLSGPVPAVLQNLTSLSTLDLSFNELQGEVPKEGIFKNLSYLSLAGNSELCGGISHLHLPACSTHAVRKRSKGWLKSLRIALAAISVILFLALVMVIILLIRRRKPIDRKKGQSLTPVVEEQYERISYQELSNGTKGFSQHNLLGKGSYGVVYKCILSDEETIAAVKVFNIEQSGSTKSFVAECEALRSVRHRCLIKIITCCSSINNQGQEFKALVFEFMPNGTLNGWLHPKSDTPTVANTLSLTQRLDIAVDIMDAVEYLHNHCQPPIVHCDLKPSNILLAEDMSARVGDFGISRILSESASKTLQNSSNTLGIRGSIGYVAPEYGEGSAVSTLADVYSLGILLLEMFTGMSPTDDMFRDALDLHSFSEAAYPDRILEIADPTLWVHAEAKDTITKSRMQECLISVIGLGLSCSKHQPKERMLIQDAAVKMHAIRDDAYLMFSGALSVDMEEDAKQICSDLNEMPLMSQLLLLLLLSPFILSLLPIVTGDGRDEAALLAFKAGISGQAARLAGWNSSISFCSWDGVTCSRRRSPPRVVALSLPSLGLAGAISPAVGNLTFLQSLDLSLNWFHGEIPPSIGRLRRLRNLLLRDNSLSGEVTANLSFCIGIVHLDLRSNQLHGHIPAELGNTLTRLQNLKLSNNSFTGPIPLSLANLSSLHRLVIDTNQFEGPIPPQLMGIDTLQVLDLARNNFSGMIPFSLHNLTSLEFFDVGVNGLYGTIPADISNRYPKLQFLSLYDNRFSGSIPSSLSNLSHLADLDLDTNEFSGYVPLALGRYQALRSLDLNDNYLEATNREGWEFVDSLTNCSQLYYLDLSGNSFRGELPSSLINLSTTLQMLGLDDLRISGNLPSDIGNLVGLNTLSICNTSLSGEIPESIGKLEKLVVLTLYNNSLSGPIPPCIGNLTNLNKLFADSNNLEGPIPTSLGKLKNLIALNLCMNHFLNGSIPNEIFELSSLSWYLDLSYNNFSGPLHSGVGNLGNLGMLALSGNRLSGQIPENIKGCRVMEMLYLDNNLFEGNIPESLNDIKGLRVLDLSRNRLSGRIPDALGSIGNLEELYLAYNNLSGQIPTVLQKLMLSKLDLYSNNLEGEVPKEGVFKNLTYFSIAENNKLCGGMPLLHLPPCRSHSFIIMAIAIAGSILFFGLAIWLVCKKLRAREKRNLSPMSITNQYERISYYALSKGTNGFSQINLLGNGGHGAVYKCILQNENRSTTAAVKVLNLQLPGSRRSFVAECEALRITRHRCIIKIITCCSSIDSQGQDFRALVFEFMPKGSLDGWLHQKSDMPTPSNTLCLSQRLDIAIDIVDALEYLHNQCQPPIVHCDLKPSNILLAEDMSARVGDFGISRFLSENTRKCLSHSSSSIGIKGSIGYVAPEYGGGCAVSTLGDVYSFGILLLEMFTGRSPADDIFRESLDLQNFVESAIPDRAMEIADPTIWLHEEAQQKDPTRIHECLVSVFRLGLSCSKQLPRERIMTRDAVAEMHAIRDANLIDSEFSVGARNLFDRIPRRSFLTL
uniref:Receptor kinase-like protein Xa21 n=1 Tax=Leersia perrieri TaxID=77586 RepID=A0A0D9UWT6_9ORYZ